MQLKDFGSNILNNGSESTKGNLNDEHAQSVTTIDKPATLVNDADGIVSTNNAV